MSARDPMRLADMTDEGGDALLSSGIRSLRDARGTKAQTEALAARLGPELAANAVAGTALLSSALVRFMWIGAGVVGVSLGSWLLWADDAGRPVAARAAEVAAPSTFEPAVAKAAPEPVPEPTAAPIEIAIIAPEQPRTAKSAPRPAARVSVEKPEPASDPEAELSLLGRAQSLLDRDPRAALTVLGEHARDYARGVFVEEREVLALEAESKLGHKALARARAERFIERFPRSAHARRVRTLLEPTP